LRLPTSEQLLNPIMQFALPADLLFCQHYPFLARLFRFL
jgi:hypothetical protein